MALPLILAFDTSAAHCAAALLRGDEILAAHAEDMRKGQAERLMPLLSEILAEGGFGYSDLSALGVGIGPGNFTGVRISVSAARGLALGLSINAYGINGFDARRYLLRTDETVAVPAPRDQVYLSRPGQKFELTEIGKAGPLPPEPAPVELAKAIAFCAARQWPSEVPAPAPLYLRPADAAPSRDAPPMLLDG